MTPTGPAQFQLGPLLVDLDAHTAGSDELSEQECAILGCLIARDQGITSKGDIYREVWGYRSLPQGRALDFAIRRLREKIEVDAANPVFLQTERGRGYRLCWAPVPAESPIATIFSVPPTLTPWEGSTDTIEATRSALTSGTRLLSLHGPAGVGKSRLIIEALHPDQSIRFIRVSSEADDRSLMTTLGQALGVIDLPIQADPETMCAALVSGLKNLDTQMLLVIDGAQAHAELFRLLTSWLIAETDLSIVLTTRVRLGIPEETVFRVEPLSIDDAEAFLISRAASAGQHLDSSAELRRLAEALDCIPLALELAAPRLRTLTPEDLFRRLQGDTALLSNPVSGISLERMVEDALRKMPSDQLTALGLISKFPHGLQLEVAEQLLGGFGDPLSLLSALMDDSLVYRTAPTDGTPRFRTTSTVARVLREASSDATTLQAVRFQIAQFALRWARPDAEARMHKPGYAELRRELRTETKNARTWVSALFEQGHESDAVELALSFAHLSAWAGRKRVALDLLLSCRTQAQMGRSICRLLALASELGAEMQDTITVDRLLRDLEAHAQDDTWSMARFSLAAMTVALARGQLAQAEMLLEGTRSVDDPRILNRAAQNEHKLRAMLGNTAAAERILSTLLTHANAADDNMSRIAHHIAQGYHAFSAGKGDDATVAYRRAIPLASHLGHQELEAGLYRRLSLAQQSAGDEEAAHRSRLRALAMTLPDTHPDAQAQLLASEAEYLSSHSAPEAATEMARRAVQLSRRGATHNTSLTCLRLAVVTGLSHPEDYPFFDLLEELETRAVSREAEAHNRVTVSFVRGMLAVDDGNPDRAIGLAKRGFAAAKPAIGQLDTVYLLGQLATLSARAGDTALAEEWIDVAKAAYSGEGWRTVLMGDPWFIRARSTIKGTT
jgi:predicted ATPase